MRSGDLRPSDGPRYQIQTWQDAEHNAAAWIRHWGYPDARVTAGGADGGIDVRARGALAQVKFRAAQVGRPDLQRLVGASGRSNAQLFFFCGTSYSRHAIEFADANEIALFAYGLNGEVTPTNLVAGAIVRARISASSAQDGAPTVTGRVARRNWRALFAYLLLFWLLGVVFRFFAHAVTPSGVIGLVTATLVVGGAAVTLLRRHWANPGATWPPHRRPSA